MYCSTIIQADVARSLYEKLITVDRSTHPGTLSPHRSWRMVWRNATQVIIQQHGHPKLQTYDRAFRRRVRPEPDKTIPTCSRHDGGMPTPQDHGGATSKFRRAVHGAGMRTSREAGVKVLLYLEYERAIAISAPSPPG